MTEDRDFKNVVRKRSAKTGESYQTARRQVEQARRSQPPRLSARVHALWRIPGGLVLGCVVDEGEIARGMPVTVMAGDTVLHQGTIAGLRRGKVDQEVVGSGECGIVLEPPFHAYLEGDVEVPGALKPIEVVPLPYLVVG